MTPERAEKVLALLEMRARGNVALRAWVPMDCCTGYGINCRLTAVVGARFSAGPDRSIDYLHHGNWITREQALKVLQGAP
jgi:hypothetical protein